MIYPLEAQSTSGPHYDFSRTEANGTTRRRPRNGISASRKAAAAPQSARRRLSPQLSAPTRRGAASTLQRVLGGRARRSDGRSETGPELVCSDYQYQVQSDSSGFQKQSVECNQGLQGPPGPGVVNGLFSLNHYRGTTRNLSRGLEVRTSSSFTQ
uniref:Uncharacterized protein n=1 Tax=Angiostrongylus cantonensis TaxID=6313 RepID=A0A0K0D976_ANGCA